MRNLTATLLTIIMSCLCAAAQPCIKWDSRIHNFGAFDENDGRVSCTFRFINAGDKPLKIMAARATCGCTTPSFTRDAVMPGDSGTVTVTFNPIGRPGRFSKYVYIESNSARDKRSKLEIKGTVIGSSNTLRSRFPVDAGVLKLRNSTLPFGQVAKGHTKTAFIDIYNTSTSPVKPTWKDLPPYISVAELPDGIPAGDYGSFTLLFDSSKCKEYGVVSDKITIVPDSREPSVTMPIDIVAIVTEDFSKLTDKELENAPRIYVKPDKLDFGIINANEKSVSKTLEISNHGESEMTVRRIYSTDKGIEVKISDTRIKPGKSATATVTVHPAETGGDILNARISIITNSPDNPVMSVRTVGEYRK